MMSYYRYVTIIINHFSKLSQWRNGDGVALGCEIMYILDGHGSLDELLASILFLTRPPPAQHITIYNF